MSKSRRNFLATTSLGLLGAALARRSPAQTASNLPPGEPPAFGTGPAVGPEVSTATFAEAERLVMEEMPIIPFFFSGGVTAVIISFGISLVAHFLVGALKSLITIRSWWASGLEMTWIGVIVAVVTYGLGLAFGSFG